jgi:acyl-CoA thioesterase-2
MPVTTLREALEVEQLDTDLFRAESVPEHRGLTQLYGGHVAARALRAAGTSVDPARLPHSLHCYFVRTGKVDRPVNYRVENIRDGRSFSLRRVTATQDGAIIFTLMASFQVHPGGGTVLDHVVAATNPPPVDTISPSPFWDTLLEVREVTPTRMEPGKKFLYTDTLWVRSATPLPDDRLVHACALTYVSDLGAGFGQLDDPTLGVGGPSLDHSLYFHAPLPADQWLLLALKPVKTIETRGVYAGSLRDQSGELALAIMQESLVRPQPMPGGDGWPKDPRLNPSE